MQSVIDFFAAYWWATIAVVVAVVRIRKSPTCTSAPSAGSCFRTMLFHFRSG